MGGGPFHFGYFDLLGNEICLKSIAYNVLNNKSSANLNFNLTNYLDNLFCSLRKLNWDVADVGTVEW